MKPALPNFIFGAIYRTRSGEQDCSATVAAFCCYTSAYRDIRRDAISPTAGSATNSADRPRFERVADSRPS